MSKKLFDLIVSDLRAAKKRDPAARNFFEIFFTYSGFHALLVYRFCHIFWKVKLKFFSKFLSNICRMFTSVEIHPASVIGSGFFIDHGAGLVIGETSKIGDNVTVYQQVTLGGISPSVNANLQRNSKRHPTIEDNVIIGSGAQVLGPITIGKNSRIGANAVVLNDVPKNTTYVGIPARKLEIVKKNDVFNPYGISDGKIDDPNKKSILALFKEIHELNEKVVFLKSQVENVERYEVTRKITKKGNYKTKGKIIK